MAYLLLAAGWLALGLAATTRAAEPPRLIRVEPPRDSGHHLGDTLDYRALISWPAGWRIDRDGLPDEAVGERPIELRDHLIGPHATQDCPDCRWLTLRWQLFKAPRATEDQRIPATSLRLRQGAELVTLELPAAVVAVSPLVPWDSRRQWLDSIRPGWRPLPFDTASRFAEAALALLLGATALLGWALSSGRLSLGRQPRPFAQAWRALRARRRDPTAPADAVDLRLWHRAMDATAGEPVFLENLDQVLAAQPVLASYEAALRPVFKVSWHHFFAAGRAPDEPLTHGDLAALLRRLAQAELASAPSRPEAADA